MPGAPLSSDHVTRTFEKNSGNLLDSVWYGIQYKKMVLANQNSSDFDEYTDDPAAIGFDEDIVDDTVEDIQNRIISTHMPEPSFSSYKNCILDLYRAHDRSAIQSDALYKQVLDALPADEPDREAKAHYIFNAALSPDDAFENFIGDLQSKFTDRIVKSASDIFDGKTHGGDARKATIGELLDKIGMNDAEKAAFIKNYKYDSMDQSIYEHHIKMHPNDKNLEVSKAMNEEYNDFQACLEKEARSEANRKLKEEYTPDEKQRIASWKARKNLEKNTDPTKNIQPWINEKGKDFCEKLSKAHTAVQMQKCRLLMESNKSLSDISPNTDYQTVIDRQAEEFSYVTQIIQGKKTAPEVIENVINEGNTKLPGLERKDAEEFINDIRKGFRANTFNVNDKDYPAKQFADIFAARILSNSVRNDRDSLNVIFNRNDLNAMSDKLMENQDFRNFIKETYIGEDGKGNAKLKDTTHKIHAQRTHGGFIEDEFKKFLLKRPAGTLENSPELARFMPTAKERIEELKKQVTIIA